ncbi:MAG: EAL domain-containing protein [Rhodoferax sp.]
MPPLLGHIPIRGLEIMGATQITCDETKEPGVKDDESLPPTAVRVAEPLIGLRDGSDMAMLATDAQGIIIESNRRACLMFGYGEEELPGLSLHLLLPPHLRERHAASLQQFVEGEPTERRMAGCNEVTGYRKDGSSFSFEASIAKFRNNDEWLLGVTLRDVAQSKKDEEELSWRATHDALTGLPSRGLIRESIVGALERSHRSGLNIALLFIDLDEFKRINGTRGRQAGDMLLKAVASRLKEQVRLGDTVARLAGDEFVVLCEQVERAATIAVLAERINDALRQPFDLDGPPFYVTASIGIAVGSGSTHSAEDMLRHADTAMLAVNGRGRDGWQFFSEKVHEQATQRRLITNGLGMALERRELSPRFQPIVVAQSGRIVGAELLLRWHPPTGEVSPAVFIPIAEVTGAIVPIGAWVFRQACLAESNWRKRWGLQAPYVSVNVSVRQLNESSLADDFAATMRETGADPTRLVLEITETALMADVEKSILILRRLADLGLRIAVDDFGTGYSSLAQLTRMPVDVLKIDKAFVDNVDKSPESRAVIRAVTGLGRSLGLKLVAEGVETGAQQLELCAYGCDFIQGYHFHRPLEEKTFVETVEREMRDGSAGSVDSLHFLIYVSRAAESMSGPELEALLKDPRTFNLSHGITGCLLYQDGYFMQMLEGKREVLFALMEKIKCDPRHCDVQIVIEGQARRRVFMDWSMALRDLTQGPNEPEFKQWQHRALSFLELAEDARTCYAHITATMHAGIAH